MANIFLTRRCNLKCPYCFADEFVNKSQEEMSFEDFKKVIDFVKTGKNEHVGLIGGEPTLSSHFKEILGLLNNDKDIRSYTVYTNGIEIDKFVEDICNDKAQLLINCNSPKDIGERYQKLKANISLLTEQQLCNFILGINLYSLTFDYSYIFELLKITKGHILRFSTSLPNSDKEESVDALKTFREFLPYLFKFFEDCYKNEIIPFSDCNGVPHCLLNSEQKALMLKIKRLADKYRLPNTIMSNQVCAPVIDVFPDLTTVRCFGFSKYLKVPMNKFKNIDTLKNYFYQKIDIPAKMSYSQAECDECDFRLCDKCSICFTYKIKQMKKLNEFVLNNLP